MQYTTTSLALPERTILVVEVGSTAHGVGVEGQEDHDETAIVIETPEQVIGLEGEMKSRMERTQPEGVRSGPGDVDRQVYSLRKFLSLAYQGNPSILMGFWAPVLGATTTGLELRELGGLFATKQAIPRYQGYMQAQTLRLLGLKGKGHGNRGSGGRTELIEQHGFDVKFAMHASRLGFQCIELLTTGNLALPIEGEPGRWLKAVRHGKVEFNEWWERTLELDADLEALKSRTDIPERPDMDKINHWSIAAHLEEWDVELGR